MAHSPSKSWKQRQNKTHDFVSNVPIFYRILCDLQNYSYLQAPIHTFQCGVKMLNLLNINSRSVIFRIWYHLCCLCCKTLDFTFSSILYRCSHYNQCIINIRAIANITQNQKYILNNRFPIFVEQAKIQCEPSSLKDGWLFYNYFK